MRLVRLAALAAFLACGGAAAAQTPGAASLLAPGEIVLEVNASETIQVPADIADFSVGVHGRGDSVVAARQAVAAHAERLVAAARTAGVPARDIYVRTIPSSVAPLADADSRGAAIPRPAAAHSRVEIRLRDVSRLPVLQAALDPLSQTDVAGPIYSLSSDSAARRAALSQALATARGDADAYAAALNMRVARVIRVTERVGPDLHEMFSGLRAIEQNSMRQIPNDPNVPVFVIVGVDFALAPR